MITLRGITAIGSYSHHDMSFPDNAMLAAQDPKLLDKWAGYWAHEFKDGNWVSCVVEVTSGPGTRQVKTYTRAELNELALQAAAEAAAAKRKPVLMYRGDAAYVGMSSAVYAAGVFPKWMRDNLASNGLQLKDSDRQEPAYPGFVWFKVTDHTGVPLVWQPRETDALIVAGADGKPRSATWSQVLDVDGLPYQVDQMELVRTMREMQQQQALQMQQQAQQGAYLEQLLKENAELRKAAKKVTA